MSTKKEIVKEVSEQANITQTEVKNIIQMTFDAILAALVRGEKVELRNFGVFIVKERSERRARNPRTGEEVIVPKKRVVIFRPGRMMDARIK